jgi:hypothetical protein
MGLQTALAAEVHPSEGEQLEEQLNTEKLRIFQQRTRILPVSRIEGIF